MLNPPSITMRRIGFLALIAAATLCLNTANHAWSANCEPTDGVNRQSIEELVGPLDEKTPEENKAEQEQRLAERRENEVRELRQAEIDRLTAKLQTALDDPNLWLSRARVRAEIHLREGAISDLTQFMKLKGKSAEQLAERGKLYYSLNQFDKAEADLNEAVQMEPDNPEILFARGKLFIEQWKTPEAYRDFSKVIEMEPRHKLARYNRAYLLLGVRLSYPNCREAAKDLKIVVDLDPDWILARYHYVRALSGSGQYEEVVRHATYVLWHDPKSECMHMYRSKAYRMLDEFDLALQDATKYMEFNPRDESRIALRAQIYTKMEEHDKAIADWNAYLEIMPNNAAAYYNLVDSYKALKRYEDALAAYDKLVEIEPTNSDWPRFRGLLKSDVGDHYGAVADLTTAIEMGGNRYSNRANVYRKMGEHAKAWADDAYQTFATREFFGETQEYEQELAEEEKVLAAHVEEQLKLLQAGEKLTERQTFRPHNKHSAWGRFWLEGLTSLVTSDDIETQKIGVQGFRLLVDHLQVYPIPPKETQVAIAALNKFSHGDYPKSLKFETSVLAKSLGVLQVANNPKTEACQPGSLHFKQFVIEKDQKDRYREFNQFGIEWIQRIVSDKNYRFRELRRTPAFIEMYDLHRGIWMRLAPDHAERSFNNKDWEFIAKGEITKR